MQTLLFTGASGFIGRNIVPILSQKYYVLAPTRKELDLKDGKRVRDYILSNHIDIVIHSANPNPVKNATYDSSDTMFEDSLCIFMNFYQCQSLCKKILYIGSGAEYDKKKEIIKIKEEDVRRSFPDDVYGKAKFIMNELASKSENIYNLRVFGCYGPFDHESKFITHAIRCCLEGRPITIRQNCYFDYLHVYDLEKVMEFMINHDLKYHDYNVASGVRISLGEIAKIVCRQLDCSASKIRFFEEGYNKEYTADIGRMEQEMHLAKNFLSLEEGIAMQIRYEREHLNEKKSC